VLRKFGPLNLLSVTKEKMAELLADRDNFEQFELIYQTFKPQVTLAVATRATGIKGAESCDPKAAKPSLMKCGSMKKL
jgi:hypothetical protein